MGQFIQDQILGMKWLNVLIGKGLSALGQDTATRWGGSVQFFLYDVIKITILLCLLIFIISYIHNWIPESWVEAVLGSRNPFGVVLATLVGVPMYTDIFGTIPVAEALLGKGALLGTILSFMMAVTTLSLPSLIMLRKAVKPRLLGTFLAICVIGIILVGYGFNAFQYLHVQSPIKQKAVEAFNAAFCGNDPHSSQIPVSSN